MKKYKYTSSGVLFVDKEIIDNVDVYRRKIPFSEIDFIIKQNNPHLAEYINADSGCNKVSMEQMFGDVDFSDPFARDLGYYVYLALTDCFNVVVPMVSDFLTSSIVIYEDRFDLSSLVDENPYLFEKIDKCSKSSFFVGNSLRNDLAFEIAAATYYHIRTQKINDDFVRVMTMK